MQNTNNHDPQGTSSNTIFTRTSPYPPGYRFVPKDTELIIDYLTKKVCNEPIAVEQMSDVELYKYHPQYLAENYPELGERQWYFFTSRQRKYPNGMRPDRAVRPIGYWKPTGAETPILSDNGRVIGSKQILVFYEGKSKPKSAHTKTNWVMHEYKLDTPSKEPINGDMKLDVCVLCRLFEKRGKSNPRRSNSNPAAVVLVEEHVVNEDRDNLLNNRVPENNDDVQELAPVHVQDDHAINVPIDQNHHHHHNDIHARPATTTDRPEDNVYHHPQLSAPYNYQDIGSNQPLPLTAVYPTQAYPPPPPRNMNFYGPNSFSDRRMFYDHRLLVNHDRDGGWSENTVQQTGSYDSNYNLQHDVNHLVQGALWIQAQKMGNGQF